MPLTPSPKPPLFIKAVKDMSSINTFEKLLKLWSKLLTFRLYNTIVSGTTNYVSIWSIKAVSPLTAHIWVVFSILDRCLWFSNPQLLHDSAATSLSNPNAYASFVHPILHDASRVADRGLGTVIKNWFWPVKSECSWTTRVKNSSKSSNYFENGSANSGINTRV